MSNRSRRRFPARCLATPLWVLIAFGAPVVSAHAQEPPSSLAAIEAEFETRQDRALADGGILSMEAFRELSSWLATTLTTYLANDPRPEDRIAARLRLVETHNNAGQPEAAAKSLRVLEPSRATMLELLEAAEWADQFRELDLRTEWIDAALARKAPFAERMQAGMILMTRLLEVKRAEKFFADELAAAKDDEARAEVLWFQAAATREREDRRDGDYEAALGDLAKRFPKTRFGSIARDRLRAMAYEVGKTAVELSGTDLAGKPYSLTELRDKVVLQFFWSSNDEVSRRALEEVTELLERFQGRGLELFSVALDDRRAELDAYVLARPVPWRTLFAPGGFDSPHALRANVEHVPHLVLVDRAGNIAEPTLTLYDAEEVAHVARRIETALGPAKK